MPRSPRIARLVPMAPWSILAHVASLLAAALFLLTALQLVAFNLGFYRLEYRKYDRPAVIGMAEDDLMATTQAILDYVTDKRPDLLVQATIQGERRQVFDERELQHMRDVKALFLAGFRLRNWLIALGLASVLALRSLAGRRAWIILARSFSRTAVAALVLAALLVALANLNFTGVWDEFHHIFFSNDLWQLDPNTEVMINMFPEEFFFDTATRVIGIFVGFMAVLGGAGWYGARRASGPRRLGLAGHGK